MKIEVEISNLENIDPTPEQLQKYAEIFKALVSTGSLDGVKAGQTIIHFDQDGVFMGIATNYWPWRRRKDAKRF